MGINAERATGGDYRADIDGLRAVAVLAVIAFHFGVLPRGFLGVDVFFVISGYLITGIIYRGAAEGRFSIARFYLRRTRRIIPLVMAVNVAVLLVAAVVMLPDDLLSASESVVATNLFGNNVLQLVTTRNYWDVVNEYKPLMHTWSLGVEEQYYMLYPFLFMLLGGVRLRWIPAVLGALTVASLAAYLSPRFDPPTKFYLLPFRFFELSAGGIVAVAFVNRRLLRHPFTVALLLALLALLTLNTSHVPSSVSMITTVFVTAALLISENGRSRLTSLLIQNKLIVGVGLISFSLYMWHQPVVSFARYFVWADIGLVRAAVLNLIIFGLSVLTYFGVEQPFRDKTRVTTRTLLAVLGIAFVVTSSISFAVYSRAGVIRDVPELEIIRGNAHGGAHKQYNMRVHAYNRDFASSDKVKILVVGNSFARDWANVLLESSHAPGIELSYCVTLVDRPDLRSRVAAADVVFVYASVDSADSLQSLAIAQQSCDPNRVVRIFGKSFGKSNGIFYNYRGPDYYAQRAEPEKQIVKTWLADRAQSDPYVDLMGKVIKDGTVPVFTPDKKFISPDCRHLTRAGARFFASLMEDDLNKMIRPK